MVVRRHKNTPSESDHDVLDVSCLFEDSVSVTGIGVLAHHFSFAVAVFRASITAYASLRKMVSGIGRPYRWSSIIPSRCRCSSRWDRTGYLLLEGRMSFCSLSWLLFSRRFVRNQVLL
jgi:hypothetical protein